MLSSLGLHIGTPLQPALVSPERLQAEVAKLAAEPVRAHART